MTNSVVPERTKIWKENFSQKVERDKFQQWLKDNHRFVQFVFHIGARTDTTQDPTNLFDN
ncbi:MAG: hypothetical protein IPP27_06920 [Bacteroidetes bacterium]|nr:hypothetical protein [Bacteroidota bacterium]